MEILKIFNNNVLLVNNFENSEAVVMGKGVGFQRKKGDYLTENDIEKTYLLKEKKDIYHIESLLEDVPMKYIMLSHKIVDFAKNRLNLNNFIYLTLADHLSWTLVLYKQGQKKEPNPLSSEIKKTYSDEYDIALKSLEIIKDQTGLELSEIEATEIALHLLNAEVNKVHDEINFVSNLVEKIKEILEIISYSSGKSFDEKSINYKRLINHLKFSIKNISESEYDDSDDIDLLNSLNKKFPMAFMCSVDIESHLGKKFELEDKIQLLIHINRLMRD